MICMSKGALHPERRDDPVAWAAHAQYPRRE